MNQEWRDATKYHKYPEPPSDFEVCSQIQDDRLRNEIATRLQERNNQIKRLEDEIEYTNRLDKAERKEDEDRIKYLRMKIDAMEIVEKMLNDQVKDLEHRNKTLLDVIKTINQSSKHQPPSKDVV